MYVLCAISVIAIMMVCAFSEREIETLERELGIKSKRHKSDNKTQNDKEASSSSPLKEPTMISIPLLPVPYQPGGEPGKGHINYLDSVDAMLETEFAPPDRYFTVSALLGRLRDPMKLPYPPNSRLLAAKTTVAKGKKSNSESEKKKKRLALEKQQALLLLDKNEIYHSEQPDTAVLLACYKKISSHKTAVVFRKPVNPLEGETFYLEWLLIRTTFLSLPYLTLQTQQHLTKHVLFLPIQPLGTKNEFYSPWI